MHTVFCPSTTNRSSWKNWLTTVCLCNTHQSQRISSHQPPPCPPIPLHFSPLPSATPIAIPTPSSLSQVYAPSSPATPSTPAVSTPVPPFPPTLYHGSREKRLLFSVWRTRGNCRRRIGRIVGVRNETVRIHED